MRRQGGGDKELWLLFWFSIGSCFSLFFGVVVFSWWVGGYGVLLCSLGGLVMEESRCFSGSTGGVKF
jgi:hypothetical protein